MMVGSARSSLMGFPVKLLSSSRSLGEQRVNDAAELLEQQGY